MNVISEVSFQQIRLVVKGYAARPATRGRARAHEAAGRAIDAGRRVGARHQVRERRAGASATKSSSSRRSSRRYGGIYVSHIGSEGMQQDKELDFAIRVAEEAKIPVHIFHLKIRGKNNWGTVGKYVAKIEAARARGLDVTANQYPYTAMQHGWSAFFPVWAREEGPEAVRVDPEGSRDAPEDQAGQGFSDLGERARLLGRDRARPARASRRTSKYEGMRIAQIAKLRGDADPADTCLAIMAEEGGTISGMFHTMSEAGRADW